MGQSANATSTRLDATQATEILQQHGIAPTPQRVAIASILLARLQHLSADQLLELIKQDRFRVSKATVYNTLSLFVRKGLVRAVIVDPTKVFYDSNVRVHHHFYDVKTGALTDIEDTAIAIAALPALPHGTLIESVDIIVRLRHQSKE